MAVYTITRFASPDMDKAVEVTESLRSALEATSADFIDFVSYNNGKGVVLARYPDEAAKEAASETVQMAFDKLIEAGAMDGEAIHPHAGDVVNSFS